MINYAYQIKKFNMKFPIVIEATLSHSPSPKSRFLVLIPSGVISSKPC